MGIERQGGPLFTGTLLSSVLAGVCINQTVTYFLNYKRDPWHHKALVALLMATISLDFAAYFNIGWNLYIANPTGTNQLPDDPVLVRPAVLFCPTMATLASEAFFSYRCYVLTGRKRIVAIILAIMTTTVFALGIVTVVHASIYTGLKEGNVLASWERWFCGALWLAAATDVVITTLLVRALWPKRQGLSARTDTLIGRVVILSVTTAALSSVLYVADSIAMIFQIEEPEVGNIEDVFLCILPHVSMLVVVGTLNLRKTIQTPSGPTYTDPFVPEGTVLGESMGSATRMRRWGSKPNPARDPERGAPANIDGLPIALSLARAGSGQSVETPGKELKEERASVEIEER